ncbi:ADP-heptose synthase [Effusibacillus lacus]|uniref:PIN domain-containing protein n=1 Tax=Effusibacillus lacus TaxID=1348429 RepID=A0A292YKT2_9BACL|nr:ADP-heptose synthase [Effusibacillus lacus]TCS73597.1 hypothetical protein EDD64_11710 [Effusibacillus lacus]GAX89511.1 hypothetical protein [Effusibacillus lacus]
MRSFAVEPVVLAIYGELLQPSVPVRFLMPLSAVEELGLFLEENFSSDEEEQAAIHSNIKRLVSFFDNPFVRKKTTLAGHPPWSVSKPVVYNEFVTVQVVNTVDTAAFGEEFDPIETELILLAMKENVPILTEDPFLQDRIVNSGLDVQVYDVEDFEFALEEGLAGMGPDSNLPTRNQNYILPIIFGSFLFILVVALIMAF